MGENIKYWANQYPDKKILIWAHTWHITRDGNYQVNAGQVVANTFGEQYFLAHFTGATGEYKDYVSMENKTIAKAGGNSLEALLNNSIESNIAFLNLRTLGSSSAHKEMPVYSNGYEQKLPASQWSKYFDGIFFIKNIRAAQFQQ